MRGERVSDEAGLCIDARNAASSVARHDSARTRGVGDAGLNTLVKFTRASHGCGPIDLIVRMKRKGKSRLKHVRAFGNPIVPQKTSNHSKVRYAVVGLGWIAQESVLPGFRNATRNSELVALVTDDPEKARKLSKEYDVAETVSYDGYDELLRSGSVDAVYIALPNNLHPDFTIRAARAGVHVLCEKPMANSVEECERMTHACEEHGVKLMIAYRLHFEPGNLKAIEIVNNGQMGEPRFFNSVFGQQVPQGNIRLEKSLDGGPLMDVGIYCINAARYLFRSEPEEVVALGATIEDDPRFEQIHEMAAAILRFPGERLASFTSSLGSASVDRYTVVGTKGDVRVTPGYGYHDDRELITTVDGKERKETFKRGDQFGAELVYFSQCILDDSAPEPGGLEGTADIRVIEAILKSMRSGQAVRLPQSRLIQHSGKDQKIELPPVKPPKIVHAQSPSAKA
jgi:predicted dehydrogenase